jgi:hypothetical protein
VKKIIAILTFFIACNFAFSQDSLMNVKRHETLLKVENDTVISKLNFEILIACNT